ncbi:MAG TPA: hypothetical protein DCQ09_13840, partial [Alcanivorax sp.]|nr:hypothetical protein [Alcanivorax sp.]
MGGALDFPDTRLASFLNETIEPSEQCAHGVKQQASQHTDSQQETGTCEQPCVAAFLTIAVHRVGDALQAGLRQHIQRHLLEGRIDWKQGRNALAGNTYLGAIRSGNHLSRMRVQRGLLCQANNRLADVFCPARRRGRRNAAHAEQSLTIQ